MLSCDQIEVGDVEPIVVNTNRTGQTVEIRICRHSDGFFLDWSDDIFKVVGSVVTLDQVLVAKDAVNAPGLYQLASVSHPNGLNTSIIDLPGGLNMAVDDDLIVIVNVTAGPSFASTNVPPGEIKLKCLVDGCVPRKTVLSRVNAMVVGDVTLSPAPAPCPTVDAAYADEKGNLLFTTHNTGGARTTTP